MLEGKGATLKPRLTSDRVSKRLEDSLELGLLALKLVENCDHCRPILQKTKRVREGLAVEPLTPGTVETHYVPRQISY
jgi:hypothetical protein